MALKLTTSYLEDSLAVFRQYKKTAERAIEQVKDQDLCSVLDAENNSIAIIVKHMAGNMRSRFKDFLTTDGEKPDRNRDTEFVDPPATREALMKMWEDGWSYVFGALEPLSEADLGRTVTIRGEAHSVMQAISRQIGHYAYHCADCDAGEAFLLRGLEGADDSEGEVEGVFGAGGGGGGESEVTEGTGKRRSHECERGTRECVRHIRCRTK
jgi:Protein of unknown function (DUF1572)